MKIITVWQPWASLIAIKAKPYEFRERNYDRYVNPPAAGERIGIHAACRPMKVGEVNDLMMRTALADPADTPCLVKAIALPFLTRVHAWLVAEQEARLRQRRRYGVARDAATVAKELGFDVLQLPLGAIVCTAVLGAAQPGDECAREFGWTGNDSDRAATFNWGWPMQDVEPVVPPFPCKGSQGFWQYNGALS